MNPWESAGNRLREQQANSAVAAPPSPAPVRAAKPVPPWVPQEEKSGAAFARRFGRGLLWFVVVLAAITGVRQWFFPAKATAPTPKTTTTQAAAYPDEEAQAVAGRFARAYLTFDEEQPDERAKLLASVLPADTDTTMGWDGHGNQDVLAVQPGTVTHGKQHQARVRVDVLIRPETTTTTKGKKTTTAEAARWIGLDVPVVDTSGRVIVTGTPGLVGIPAHGPKAPDLSTAHVDTELSAATQSVVEKFFGAYASGDTDTVTAPGASVPALPAGITYKDLSSWSVDDGTGSDRIGTAVVSWTLGGATVEQTYRVTLTRVSSSDAARWQVAEVHGGSL
ncbi:conjugal transfer protein [Streptomyces sp. NPDC048341]|uniref:conjugal transfer protein n=1 Tax=Streptomyces sp. NPDC048341 TaxID=3154620 RepID=UPI003412277B